MMITRHHNFWNTYFLKINSPNIIFKVNSRMWKCGMIKGSMLIHFRFTTKKSNRG